MILIRNCKKVNIGEYKMPFEIRTDLEGLGAKPPELRSDTEDSTRSQRPLVSVSRGRAMARMVENGINDRIWWY
jgi:hypothetical protein